MKQSLTPAAGTFGTSKSDTKVDTISGEQTRINLNGSE
jgi:hypothetical protein